MGLSLTGKVVGLHRSLAGASLPHAFGGALALAFCTHDPRATHDIDVNIFVGTTRIGEVLAALPADVVVEEAGRQLLARDGQARLWWDGTPIDVFLSSHPFHDQAQERCRTVRFADADELPVLSCDDLAVFKAFFARPKDAVDISAMVEAGALDTRWVLETVAGLLGADSPNHTFLAEAVRAAGARAPSSPGWSWPGVPGSPG